MLAIYSNLLFRTTLFVIGTTATIVVSNADESLKYRFRGGFFTVDYGVLTEMSESDGRSFRLENDLSDAQLGAQITTRSIEGGGYLSFDWAIENEASPSDYSYLRISPRKHNLPNFEHTFHSPSMEEDRGTFRRYLPEGEIYTVSIGVHSSDSNSGAYDLEIHNLNFERIEHPETGLVPELDTYLFVSPNRAPNREGTDLIPDLITLPGYTGSGPRTTIPTMPITTLLSTTTVPFSGTNPAPTLTAFTLPSFSLSSGTGNGPTETLETHSVPDSSLGFLGIATLLSLLFTKALMPKSTFRN